MRISIVTPNYNQGEYIEQTIKSVIKQEGDFQIEYIIVDGGSSDSSLDIIKKYDLIIKENFPNIQFKWISEKDNGMYDAIVKGFSIATGDIYAWINGDDYYLPGAFQYITDIFTKYSNVNWLKGITNRLDVDNKIKKGVLYEYKKDLITKGVYGTLTYFIQQDSVFWRSELWKKIKNEEIKDYKFAGDFRLWQLFAQYEDLYTFNKEVSVFRKHPNQKSSQIENYLKEAKRTINYSYIEGYLIKNIFKLQKLLGFKFIHGKVIR